MNLKHLTDKFLLGDIKRLAKNEREVSLKVLHHLREIERRRLFSDLGYGSLFDYAVRELGYSEPSAARRIHSARILKEMPELEKKIEDGSLNMTNVALAAQLFKNENISNPEVKQEIMAKIENTTKKQCEKELIKYVMEPAIPKELIKPITYDLNTVKMNFSNETLDLLDQLKGLMAHQRLSNDEMMKKIFIVALDQMKKKKYKVNASFTTLAESPCTTRYIPAIIKKEVYVRDSGQCSNCKSKYKLEYDHIKPFSQGGKSTFENLRLLCFSCNQRRLKT